MKKPEIPNLKLIVASGSASIALLAVLILLIVKLNTMEDPLINLNVSVGSTPVFSMVVSSEESKGGETLSSQEESSEPEPPSSKAPASSKPASFAPRPVSSQEAVSSEGMASSEDITSSGESSGEPAPSDPETPIREDGITRIELINVGGGTSGDLPAEKFDEFLSYLNGIVFEETEEEIDSSVVVDARVRIYKGDDSVVYTVYPFWARGSRVLLEIQGGKQFLQYLKTLEVFAGHSFAY